MLPAMSIQTGRSGKQSVMFVVALASLAAAGSGCAYGHVRQVIRSQFAAELKCPEVKLGERKSYEEGYVPGQVQLRGCGVTRTYSCPVDDKLVSFDDKPCSYVNGDPSQPSAVKSSPDSDAAGGGDEASEPVAPTAAPAPATTPAAAKPAAAKPAAAGKPAK